MPIYWGRRKIKNRGDSGVYYGNRKIKFVYFGNKLVYSYESYNPNTTLVNITNGASKTLELLPGVYQIKMAGGGGYNVNWAFQGYPWGASGGSGGSIEGTFFLSTKKTVNCYAAPESSTASYVDFNNTRGMTAGGGGNAAVNSSGTAGVASLGSGFENMTLSVKNGNKGIVQSGHNAQGAASVCSKKWGGGKILRSGEVQYGGIEIVYLRRWK